MLNRRHIAIIALATAGFSTAALATGDAGVQPAARLLEQARDFGTGQTTGQAAGDRRDEHRALRGDEKELNASERFWRQMERKSGESN